MKSRRPQMKNKKKGFTLVELIVVIVIILILSAVAVPVLMHYIGQATSARDINNAKNVLTATQLTVADTFTDSFEGEYGEYVNHHVKNSYQALTNTADPPRQDSSHPLINILYDKVAAGSDTKFKCISLIDDYEVRQVAYKNLETNKVYVWWCGTGTPYGSDCANLPAQTWTVFDSDDSSAWVRKYAYKDSMNSQVWWNGDTAEAI